MTDEELDQLEHEERTMVEINPSTGSGHRQGQFDPALFDPATASIEIVWNWLCQRVPGLRESPGLGVPPNNKASPLTYCEGHLYHLIGEVLSLHPVWSTAALSEFPQLGICEVQVEFYAGYVAPNGRALFGQATVHCVWGDTSQQPAKEARLRAVAAMLLKAGTERTP